MQMKSNQQRISTLKGMLKSSMLLVVLFILLQLFKPDVANIVDKEVEIVVKENLFLLKPDYMQLELVANRPLLIFKYSDADRACLSKNKPLDADWFVAWAQGGELVCPLVLLSADVASERLAYKACRSLQDQCGGSLYDLRGNAYPRQLSSNALASPTYTMTRKDDKLILTVKVRAL